MQIFFACKKELHYSHCVFLPLHICVLRHTLVANGYDYRFLIMVENRQSVSLSWNQFHPKCRSSIIYLPYYQSNYTQKVHPLSDELILINKRTIKLVEAYIQISNAVQMCYSFVYHSI